MGAASSDAIGSGHERRPRRRCSARCRVGVGGGVAVALLTVSAVAAGDLGTALWSVSVVLAFTTAVWLAHAAWFRGVSVVGLGALATALTAATLVAGSQGWLEAVEGVRVTLLDANPNVVAAGLVTAFVAWVAVSPKRRWVWWAWPIVAVAVLYTGSRTGGGALLAAGAAWLVLEFLMGRRRGWLVPVAVIGIVGGAAWLWQRGVVESTPNLLAAPNDLSAPAWDGRHAEQLVVVADAVAGPFEGTRAQRLIATARPDTSLVLYQTVKRSPMDVPFVASVYLRADEPQRVRLDSNLASVRCDVDVDWRRCVTPVGYGNERSMSQLKLHTAVRGGSFDVYVYGAQYERGHEATPFVDAQPRWLPRSMVNRLDLRRLDLAPPGRLGAVRAGVAIARDHPWFGVGRAAAPALFLERTTAAGTEPLTYAHNLFVEGLVVHGGVGLLGWLLLAAAVAGAVAREGRRRLAPLVVALLVLATWDVTFFSPMGFVPMTVAVAYWIGVRESPARSSAHPGPVA